MFKKQAQEHGVAFSNNHWTCLSELLEVMYQIHLRRDMYVYRWLWINTSKYSSFGWWACIYHHKSQLLWCSPGPDGFWISDPSPCILFTYIIIYIHNVTSLEWWQLESRNPYPILLVSAIFSIDWWWTWESPSENCIFHGNMGISMGIFNGKWWGMFMIWE